MRDVPELEAVQARILKLGRTIWRVVIGIGSWAGSDNETDEVLGFGRRQNNSIIEEPHGLVSRGTLVQTLTLQALVLS